MENTKGLCMGCMGEIGEEQICSICGYDNSATVNGEGLPVRTILGGKYIVGKVLDFGGEGKTYIGKKSKAGRSFVFASISQAISARARRMELSG